MLRERRISCDQLRSDNQVKRSGSQHGHVQRLANVASRLRPMGMLVEQASACCEIQQHGASQHRQRPARVPRSENGLTRLHESPYKPSTLDAEAQRLGA